MAFNVTLYTFSKRKNSTAKPTVGLVFSGLMREPCGVIRPSVSFEFAAGANPSAYNYAYIPDFGRYYFINEWTSVGRLWVCSMEVDALASWKTEIENSTQYVLRSSHEFNGNIADAFYPLKADYSLARNDAAIGYTTRIGSGWYVVGIINSDTSAVGAVSYYVFSPEQFNSFKGVLMSTPTWTSVEEITDELLKTLFNPFQYISSCKWFPRKPPVGETVQQLKFGWWELDVTCEKLSAGLQYERRQNEFYDLPKHPQSAVRGDYLNTTPYSEYTLLYAPYGAVELPGWVGLDNSAIILDETIDYLTGIATLVVYASAQAELQEMAAYRTAKIAIDVQIAQLTTNYMPALQEIGSAAGALLERDIKGAVASAASGIVSAITAAPSVQTSGGNGGFSDLAIFNTYATIECKFTLAADDSLALHGRPLCAPRRLGDVPGFIMCAQAHFAAPATTQELDMINAYLDGGIFLE